MMWVRRKLYPANWKQIAHRCKELADWRCEWCGARQRARRKSKRTGKWYRVYLHAAHKWMHDTLNPHPELLCLCPRCHGRYDYWLRLRETIVRLEMLKHRIRLHQCSHLPYAA